MAVAPIVRYMILCDDWEADADHEQRFTIHGLMTGIRSVDDPPYPLLYEELRILLLLTEGTEQGMRRSFASTKRLIYGCSEVRSIGSCSVLIPLQLSASHFGSKTADFRSPVCIPFSSGMMVRWLQSVHSD